MITRRSLTPRQNEYYEYIRKRIESGLPPTIPEICGHFDLKSTNGVHQLLDVLEKKGYIVRERGKSRGISLPETVGRSSDGVRKIPIVGTGNASNPFSIFLNPRGVLVPDPTLLPTENSFAAVVSDDAMDGEGIFKGDHVVVRQAASATAGALVFALVGDEQLVRRLGGGEDAMLMPSNRHYPPIPVDDAVAIVGVVAGVIRTL